jgi:hypothetical protein
LAEILLIIKTPYGLCTRSIWPGREIFDEEEMGEKESGRVKRRERRNKK